jgi:hypothetical protein
MPQQQSRVASASIAAVATNFGICNTEHDRKLVVIGLRMARRRQFKGICWDVLNNFISRYNDLNGYWAVGQFAQIAEADAPNLSFRLREGVTTPPYPEFAATSSHYWRTVLRLMASNKMPEGWLSDATILFSMVGPNIASCRIEITTDLGRTYSDIKTVAVKAHDPIREHRRLDRFGPSNQKGV